MELNRTFWSIEDGKDFIAYLETLKNPEKIDWSRRILNTSLPILALSSATMGKICKQICQGNLESFLDLRLDQYYEVVTMRGSLLVKIKDEQKMLQYLIDFTDKVDNWASIDCIDFKKLRNKPDLLLKIAHDYCHSSYPFTRRMAMRIMFQFVDEEHLPLIFSMLDSFENEEHYYVNMVNAWLLCECFTKYRDLTLPYIAHNKLNRFTFNKAISKCCDSYRVSDNDKLLLKQYVRRK